MKLSTVIAKYVEFRASLGSPVRGAFYRLKAFSRHVGDIEIGDVRRDQVLDYLNTRGRLTAFWHDKKSALAGLYRYAIPRGYASSSPLPGIIPKRPLPNAPYIYSSAEVQSLLQAAESLASSRSPLRGQTFRTFILFLYAAGLRASEALSLTLADVDLDERLLIIRETKFHKTRFVPICAALAERLRRYVELRRTVFPPSGKDSAFLASLKGRPVTYKHASKTFVRIRAAAGARRSPDARYQPRLHDLRHTFAVRRLVTWYRQGADVQRLLPKLATYLGHVSIASTQLYLQMTPELLEEGSRRFDSYAAVEGYHG